MKVFRFTTALILALALLIGAVEPSLTLLSVLLPLLMEVAYSLDANGLKPKSPLAPWP